MGVCEAERLANHFEEYGDVDKKNKHNDLSHTYFKLWKEKCIELANNVSKTEIIYTLTSGIHTLNHKNTRTTLGEFIEKHLRCNLHSRKACPQCIELLKQ